MEGSDIVEGPVAVEEPVSIAATVERELVDTSFLTQSLVEEAVTSGGDSGQWECKAGDEECEPEG